MNQEGQPPRSDRPEEVPRFSYLEVSQAGESLNGASADPPLGPASSPGALGTLGPYELVCRLGEGGMGVVYRARDLRDGRDIAVKVLKPALADRPRLRAMFLKEARHQQALQHPRVVPLLDCAETTPVLFLAMPWMRRGSLAALLGRDKSLCSEDVIRWARNIAEALVRAHERGIIHRDLKPTNVLLDEDGGALLADFGLSRSLWNDELTDASRERVEGSVPYLSPAGARGEAEDTRADIYAFGALLYEMLTGRPPYEGATRSEVIARILAGPPRPIRELNPTAPLALVAIAEGAMQRDLRRRYAHVRHLADDLTRVSQGLPPQGPTGSGGWLARLDFTWRRLKDYVAGTPNRRRRTAGVAVVVSIGVAGVGGWWWLHPSARLNVLHRIELPAVDHWVSARTLRWSRRSMASLAVPTTDRLLHLLLNGAPRVDQAWPLPIKPGRIFGILPGDFDGDGLEDAVVGWGDGTNLAVSAINHSMVELIRFPVVATNAGTGTGPGPLAPSAEIFPRILSDLDGDHRPELLVVLGSGQEQRPRGILCYDAGTGLLRWWHETAGHVIEVSVGDIDGDGRTEVIYGTDAVGGSNVLPDVNPLLTRVAWVLWMTEAFHAGGSALGNV